MKTDPRYQSDSEKLQTAINKMTANLVNIGKFKFDETEMPILQQQARDVASILDKLGGARSETGREEALNEVERVSRSEGFTNEQTKMDVLNENIAQYSGRESKDIFPNLEFLRRSESQNADPNARIAGAYFNEIFGALPDRPSEKILRLLFDLSTDAFNATRSGRNREAGEMIGENEIQGLVNTMQTILRELGILDQTLERLQERGIPVHGEATVNT